jgi:hypothetical protein
MMFITELSFRSIYYERGFHFIACHSRKTTILENEKDNHIHNELCTEIKFY